MSFKYGAYIKHFYYLKKGEVSVKNEFKAGDLVFVVDTSNKVVLGRFKKPFGSNALLIEALLSGENYMGFGYKATPENRQALVTLYGEDAVPKLPLRGSELTKKLLEKQKYVLCFCSDTNDDDCREIKRPLLITCFEDGYFYEGKADITFVPTWKCAVPIDMNGNEITEIE